MVTQHRPERHHPRPTCDKEQRATAGRFPDEVAADRAAQLQLVAGAQLVDEEGGDLAVVESLDGEHDAVILGRRGDRVAALGLIPVFARQA